jgi:hypothetical protein
MEISKGVFVWRRAKRVKLSRAVKDESLVRLALEAVNRSVLGWPGGEILKDSGLASARQKT